VLLGLYGSVSVMLLVVGCCIGLWCEWPVLTMLLGEILVGLWCETM
jgi:hypothetical protein